MKKCLYISMFLCSILLLFSSCSSKNTATSDNTAFEDPTTTIQNVDIDLTKLSSTMVYAEVYNIMVNPEDYMGKSIRMSGPYYSSYYDETDLYYHYVIIEDAAACCQQGLEFIWNGEHTYPEDYPDDKTLIEVVGIFNSYEELGYTYYYLSVDDILIIDDEASATEQSEG